MFQNKQKVVVVSGGDPTRVIKVQAVSGVDAGRYPTVDTTGVTGRDQQVQIVSGGDEARFPKLQGLADARSTADSVITALSPAAWYRNATDVVSSGGFASIWADYASSAKGLVLPGVAANRASAPAIAAYIPSNTVSFRARVLLSDWTPAGGQFICGQYSAGVATQDGPFFYVNLTTGRLGYGCSDNTPASKAASSSVAPTVSDGSALWVRVDHDNAAGEVKFYTAADSTTIPASGDWTQLGTTQAIATFGAFNATPTQLFQSGACATGGATFPVSGTIYRVISIVDGVTVFDADFSTQTIGASSFTESSSNAATVTINTSGASPAHIGKARDLLQGTGTNQPAYAAGVFTFDGADNYMVAATWAQAQPTTIYYVLNPNTWTGSDQFSDGTAANSGWVYQTGVTPSVSLYAGGAPAAANTTITVGAYHIVCVVFNGASSSLRADNSAKTTGNPGATGMGGFTLAARASAASPSNILVKEVVIFNAAHDDATQSSVITALNNALTVF